MRSLIDILFFSKAPGMAHISKDCRVLLATHMFIHKQNEPYLSASQPESITTHFPFCWPGWLV